MSDNYLFAGLKVLDVGSWIAGPVAATMLADYGADVIKIEMPGVGDQYRLLSAAPNTPEADVNYMWQMDGRNKRSLALNLKTADGMAVLHKLIRDCDIYITNHPFPMRRALQLGYEDLRPLNPSMIYASLTAYGEKGPDKDREGFDLVAYWARTGMLDLFRAPGAAPTRPAGRPAPLRSSAAWLDAGSCHEFQTLSRSRAACPGRAETTRAPRALTRLCASAGPAWRRGRRAG